jgi:hypothetical protein
MFFISPAPARDERCDSTEFSLLQFKSKRYRQAEAALATIVPLDRLRGPASFFTSFCARISPACVAPPRGDVGSPPADFATLI